MSHSDTPDPARHPFATLSPDLVLDAVESLGLRTDGRLLALNSYENRVYQVGIEDSPPIVAKFYRPLRWSDGAILEEHAFVQALAEAELPVVPAFSDAGGHTLHRYAQFSFATFPRRGGRAPAFDDMAILEWMGRFIARMHATSALRSYSERPALTAATFGHEPAQYLLQSDFVPQELRSPYTAVLQQALEQIEHCFMRAGHVMQIRLHGDCHAGNVLWTDSGPHFVDFDDSRTGPAVQDLWMLLSGDRSEQTVQLSHVLEGYEEFRDFDYSELHLIEALRTLRLIHYSAWIARRWDDPAFPPAFPWFDTPRYWEDRILELREQLALMSEPPLTLSL